MNYQKLEKLIDLWREAENELSEEFGDYQKALELKDEFSEKTENLTKQELDYIHEEIENSGG